MEKTKAIMVQKCLMQEEERQKQQRIYYNKNADRIKNYQAEYNKQNADIIKKQQMIYYNKNSIELIEKQKEYNKQNADRIKNYQAEYYKKNKERLDKIRCDYREENAEKIKKQQKTKVMCECGTWVANAGLKRHQKTKKHLNLMKLKECVVIKKKRKMKRKRLVIIDAPNEAKKK